MAESDKFRCSGVNRASHLLSAGIALNLLFSTRSRYENNAMRQSLFGSWFSTRYGAVVLALCVAAFGARADEKAGKTPFDGVWQTTLSCENSHGALGYSFRFASTVKNGTLHGEKGTAHEAGWLSIDGTLTFDGAADLYVDGLVGASAAAVGQRPAGTQYGYHVAARFTPDRGEGHRVEGRPCTVIFTREK